MVSWFLLMLQLLLVLRIAVGFSISKPNCVDHCGDVKIPYPFGIGTDCYYNRSYEITCNASFGSSKPFLRQINLEVLNISGPGAVNDVFRFDLIVKVSLPRKNICESSGVKKIISYDLKGTSYLFSAFYNKLMMEGCESRAVMKSQNGTILASCASICASDDFNMIDTNGNGDGRCTASIGLDIDFDYFEIEVVFKQQTNSNSCNASVALIDNDFVSNLTGSLSNLANFRTALQWKSKFPPQVCDGGRMESGICSCPQFYEGNPYLPNGCQVVQECENCKTYCDATYNYTLDLTSNYYVTYHCKRHSLFRRASFLAFFIGAGVVLLALGFYWLYRFVKRRREIKQKAKHFKRNGGLLLQQQMSSDEGVVETTKLFTVTELEKATDNFNDNRILGQGGQGMVYKGMLMDGKIVAIKTAKKVDESQVEQFINELVILSRINHRNVVKVLGCCLETEVPILVYEFIPNGTLYELIHDQGQEFHLNWKMRLKIAAESAEAVAYLHSSSSAPIYHRDIKSTNILLDEKYRAKVSDFGTSKAINIDQTHVTTVVLGTYGYLDPEYFQSNQFTEKSDVYSFGVVLVELITGKKPICPTGNGGWINLATEFLTGMEEGRVLDMLDARIINEGKEDEFMAIVEIARKCLNMNGKQRPTMKEIAVYLDGIRSSHIPIKREHGHVNSNQGVTEVIYANDGPFGNAVFSSENDPPACSIELQPLMDTKYFTANVV
ncbi:wall-associated receptor kinase-like 9 [Silene latifolia]|uniref:wall-associated receptor kinase-like 9 n=1 Tax=Silene latifolia TaxID=37657 RepID=UPI003D777647